MDMARAKALGEVFTTNLRIEDIELGVFTPRLSFSPDYLKQLAESIENRGQDKPIICRPHPTVPERYQCVDGEHRVRAMRTLGAALIRSEVRMLNDTEARILALTVNQMHGKQLEEAEIDLQVKRLRDEDQLTFEQIADRLGMSYGSVYNSYSRAKNLSPKVREKIINRLIKPTQAAKLAELDREDQDLVAEMGRDLTKRKTMAVVEALKAVETPEEKILIVEKLTDPKIPSEAAVAVAHAVKEASTMEEKQCILSKPLETYAQLVKTPEQLKRLVRIAPEEAVLEVYTCECGRGHLIDWVMRTVKPQAMKGLTFTCFFCGSRLGEEKLAERMKESERDPTLHDLVKERYREVFEVHEQPE